VAGVVDFARAVNADLMISFAIGGTCDASGVWTPDQARGPARVHEIDRGQDRSSGIHE